MRRGLACISSLILLAGCTTYIEKPTPTASIPEAPTIAPPRIQELPRTQPGEPMAGSPGVYGSQIALDGGILREGGAVAAAGQGSTRFAESYKAAGKPRIAILFNRQLSDEVREWRTEGRVVAIGEGSVTHTRDGVFGRESETVKGPVAVAVQTQMEENGQRVGPGERYTWGFEDGFMQPFLRAGAVLVDRATIMRLASRDISQGSKADPIGVKKVEMDALVNNADVFIEILISRSPSALYGYEFKATAKEIRSGRILASSTSLNWDRTAMRPKKVITTDKGYQIVDDNAFPAVQKLSGDLALDLMNSLAAQWERR